MKMIWCHKELSPFKNEIWISIRSRFILSSNVTSKAWQAVSKMLAECLYKLLPVSYAPLQSYTLWLIAITVLWIYWHGSLFPSQNSKHLETFVFLQTWEEEAYAGAGCFLSALCPWNALWINRFKGRYHKWSEYILCQSYNTLEFILSSTFNRMGHR